MILTLKQLRILSNLTQKELAQKLRISTNTWNNYERGLAYPPIKTIESIESFFNISYNDIQFIPTEFTHKK